VQKTIDDVVAEAAIREVQIRYCRAVDRMDFELLRSCFHPDASTDYGFFKGGVDGFIDMGRKSLANFAGTTHFTGNQLVEVSGDSAWAEHYTVATHRCPPDEQRPLRDFVTAVRYIDRMERRGGDWRIVKRVLILDWVRTDPVAEAGESPKVETGKRDASDASYSLRRGGG
jgi:hypothetical protein